MHPSSRPTFSLSLPLPPYLYLSLPLPLSLRTSLSLSTLYLSLSLFPTSLSYRKRSLIHAWKTDVYEVLQTLRHVSFFPAKMT